MATASSWLSRLSTPGGTVSGWAIAAVSVAPTHRRRGIARQIIEAELRNARRAGAALAMLTASEATLYGRYGFGPAAYTATLTIDRNAARWRGDGPAGRVHVIEPKDLRLVARELSDAAALRTPGEIERWPLLLDEALGLVEADSESSRSLRAIRYDDARGVTRGFATYRVDHQGRDVLTVDHLAAVDDDAEAGLWKSLVEHDLVDEIHSTLRSVEEPVPWLLEDRRSVTWKDQQDHLWLRILDPIRALKARTYPGEGRLVLDVVDPGGIASGRFALEIPRGGSPTVTATTDSADLLLGVAELSAIYLGGTRSGLLARAGRIEGTVESLALADRLFYAERAPHLSIWF